MKYEHFTDGELACPCCLVNGVKDEFMTKIEAIREELDLPMYVTSGFRCDTYNKAIKGARRSAHKNGLALDIMRKDGIYARKVTELAIKHGINGIEIGTGHIHLDDKDRVAPVIWSALSK